MNFATNIGLVTGGLSLVAFIIAAGLYAYRAKLKSRENLIQSVPSDRRPEAINDTAEYLRIDTTGMNNAAKERIVFAQLRYKSRRDMFFFLISLLISLLLAFIAIVSIGGGSVHAEKKEFSEIGDHVKVDCDKDGKSNVRYTADGGYHIQNVFANVHEPREVRNTSAVVTSNDGRTATATAAFSGRKKEWTGNCPSSGSAQVRIYGTIVQDEGWLAAIYSRLISGLRI